MQLTKILPPNITSSQDLNGVNITGVSIDSRTIKHGNLFIAIVGENQDGHKYIQSAIANGAAALIVSKEVNADIPVITVDDTSLILQEMANYYRSNWHIPVVAVTGSCGKTTTKNLIGSILNNEQETLSTAGNFNNLFGLPLTMLKLDAKHKYSVFEVGASFRGEIAKLAAILKPNIAVITNAAASHLENMGKDVEAIAKEKGQLLQSLPDDGIAIVNLDDAHASYWLDIIGKKKWYGFSLTNKNSTADNCLGIINAHNIKKNHLGSEFSVCYADEELNLKINIPGQHNIENALAAIAVAKALSISSSAIIKGLSQADNEAGRLNIYSSNNKVIIDDSYNANPKSFSAAIDVLSQYKSRKIVVMGDMLELAEASESSHREIGALAASKGIDMLLSYGAWSKYAVEAFGTNAKRFDTKEQLFTMLENVLGDSYAVLVKGSRSMGMEYITKRLKDGI